MQSKNCTLKSKNLDEVIDNLGFKSMMAQKLPGIITSSKKFWVTSDTI
jgi:hypothetical protein